MLGVLGDEQGASEFGAAGTFAGELAGAVGFCVGCSAEDSFHWVGMGWVGRWDGSED